MQVPFDCKKGTEVPLFEHLEKSFYYTVTHLGPHKLPLIGRADWNDCLNLNCFSSEPGESFQTTGPSEGPVAESVFIAGMFVKYGKEFEELCERTGHTELAKEAGKAVDEMYQAVLDNGWDGEWFLRAYDAQSEKVGSKECEEGKIFIEPQGFCVMAGIGKEEGIAEKALDSVNELLETKYGIMILQPAYTRYHLELGEITSYPLDIKKMQEFSATTIRGFPLRRLCLEEETGHLRFIVKYVHLILRKSVIFTGQNHMYIRR